MEGGGRVGGDGIGIVFCDSRVVEAVVGGWESMQIPD